jgi:hypothetical protein
MRSSTSPANLSDCVTLGQFPAVLIGPRHVLMAWHCRSTGAGW